MVVADVVRYSAKNPLSGPADHLSPAGSGKEEAAGVLGLFVNTH
jgi:hypothetical protein